MNFQPTWKSKGLLLALGHNKTMTLLDTIELMYHQDFKKHELYPKISTSITTAVASSLVTVLALSLLISKKYFKTVRAFSLSKTMIDLTLVLGVNYLGLLALLSGIRQEVSTCKTKYLSEYNPDFMLHFDILCAKYGIDQQQQTQGIFSSDELKQWMEGYIDLHINSQ